MNWSKPVPLLVVTKENKTKQNFLLVCSLMSSTWEVQPTTTEAERTAWSLLTFSCSPPSSQGVVSSSHNLLCRSLSKLILICCIVLSNVVTGALKIHENLLCFDRESRERISLIHTYHHAFIGFSTMLTEEEAALLSGKGVLAHPNT